MTNDTKAFEALVNRAVEAGLAAVAAMTPTPMTVTDGTRRWHVPDGVCGFAGVRVRPGTSAFAKYLVKHWAFRKSYYGGVESSVALFNQSMERKEAYATAYAKVLSDAGYTATMWSRMD